MKNNNTKPFFNTTIPVDWEVKKLSDCCDIKGEYGINAAAVEYSDKLPTYLRITDIDDDGNYTAVKKASVNNENSDNFILKNGDIVFARTGATVGKTYLYKEVDGNLVFAGFLIRFRPNKNQLNVQHLKYFTDSKIYWDWVKTISMRSGQPGINAAEYGSLKLALPPLPEQRAIAKALSLMDTAINFNMQLIAQKELRKKWLMQQLLSEKRIVKNEKWCRSGLKRVKLGDIAVIKKGKPITEKEIQEGFYPVIAGGKTSPYSHNDFSDENIITISASGAYAGYVAFHPNKIWASDCSVVEELKGKSVVSYLYYQLIYNQDKIYKLQTGGAQPHVFPKDIFHFSLFIVYSLEEQTAIAKVLQIADKEIEILKAKTEKLREQKKGMMQVLLTGKKRLNLDAQD